MAFAGLKGHGLLSALEKKRSEEARVENPLHNRVDGVASAYSCLADDSTAEMKKRKAALLLSTAEGHLNNENTAEAKKTAEEALQTFRQVGDKNATHDAVRLVINALRMEGDLTYEGPEKAQLMANQEGEQFSAQSDKRGMACMLLSRAECYCDARRIKASELKDAEDVAQEALGIFRELEDRKMIATTLLQLAHIYSLKEEADDVFEAATEAREVFKTLDDKKGDARALHGVAMSSVLKRKFPDALGKMKEVLTMFKELGVKKFEAFELCVMAEVHLEDEKPLRALPVARQAMTLFRELDYGKGWEAAALLAVTRSLIEKHQTKQAAQAAKEGVERFKKIGDKRQEVFALHILADVHLSAEAFEEALEICEQASEAVKVLGDKRMEIDSLHMMMWCYMGTKEWTKAMEQMEDVVNLAQDLKDEHDEASAVHNIAYLTMQKKELKSALEKVDEAKTLYSKVEDKKGEASSCMISAGCLSDEGELEEAILQAIQARDLFAEARATVGEGDACAMLAELYLRTDKAEEALQMAERRLALMQDFASKKREASAMHQLAHVHMSTGSLDKAEQLAQESKKLAAGVHDRKAETEAQLMITQIYIAMDSEKDVPERGAHPLERALRSATDSVSLSGKTGDRALQAMARYWRAYLLAQTGRLPDAARAAEEAKTFFKKTEDDRCEAVCLILQANVANEMGQRGEAKGFVLQAIEISSGIGDKEMEADGQKLLDRVEGKGQVVQQVVQVQETVTTAIADAPAVSVVAKAKGLDATFVRKQLMTFVKDVMASDDELELDSPFMEAGMDSLSSVSLMSMVAKEFQMALSPSLVFDFPTVRALEDHLVEESKN